MEFEPTEPDIRRGLTSQSVPDGSTARLECLISGDPKPNVTWFKEGTLLPPSDDFLQFHDDDNMISLVIKEVYPEDAGTYTVVAKNPSGTAQSSAGLVVEEGNAKTRLSAQMEKRAGKTQQSPWTMHDSEVCNGCVLFVLACFPRNKH